MNFDKVFCTFAYCINEYSSWKSGDLKMLYDY